MLEAPIEKAVREYAESKGWIAYKFSSPQRASVPDRLMVMPGGRMFFIELKATGKKPTTKQTREHTRLRVMGVTVYVVDSIEQGKAIIDDELREMEHPRWLR